MSWLLIIMINAPSPNPVVVLERFPDQHSCEVVSAKIRGYAADRVIDTECIQDAEDAHK